MEEAGPLPAGDSRMKKAIVIICSVLALALLLGYCLWIDRNGDKVDSAGKTR